MRRLFVSGRTRVKVVAFLLAAGLSTPAFAGDIQQSVDRHAAELAAQPTSNGGGISSHDRMLIGLGLVGGGAALALYGFNHVTGASLDVNTNAAGTSGSIGVNEEHATGVGIAGLAVAGVGGFLMMQASRHPMIVTIAPGRLAVARRIAF